MKIKVIARGASTVDELSGKKTLKPPSLHCPSLTHLFRAIVLFRRGRSISATSAVRVSLERAIFDHECVLDDQLILNGIDPWEWKSLIVRCLLKANGIDHSYTCWDWQNKAGVIILEELLNFGIEQNNGIRSRLKPQKRPGWDNSASDFIPKLPSHSAPKGSPQNKVSNRGVHILLE